MAGMIGFSRDREGQEKGGAAPRGIPEADFSIQHFSQLLCDAQPQAKVRLVGAGLIGPVKAIKEEGPVRLRNAGPVVGNGKGQLPCGQLRVNLNGAAFGRVGDRVIQVDA